MKSSEEQESVEESWEKNWISDDTDDEYHAGPSNHANHVDDSMPDLVLNSPFKTLSESDTLESEASKIFETDVSQVNESVTEHYDNDFDSLPDLVSILDSSGKSSVDEDDDEDSRVSDDGLEVTYTDDIIIDNGGETEILTFMTAMLANIEEFSNHETELYDSGASCHMFPYCNKFFNFVSIKPKTIQAADSQEFGVT